MSNLLQYVYFSRHALDVSFVFDAIFLEDFDRHFLACDCVRADSDLSEGARTK